MLKKILIALAVLLVLIVVTGLILPKDFRVERSILIGKPKAEVFAEIRSFKNQNEWSAWGKLDPNMKIEYRGTDGQVGAISAWSGDKNVGVGEQEIKSLVEGERIETELRFREPMQDVAIGYFVTEAVGEKETKVTWGMKGVSPFPLNIFCYLMDMQGMIGKDYETGLNNLKAKLEKTP